MDYIGSKVKLNEWLFEHIAAAVSPSKNTVLMDACSGSGAVSRYAAKLGYNVISNDIMEFPRAIANGSIGLSDSQLEKDRKSTRLNSSHLKLSRMPSSA